MKFESSKLDNRFSLQLETLRGLSAIIVLFTHCFQTFIAPFDLTLYSWIRLLGQAAVMMFFVLSGFLIGHSIQQNIRASHHFNLRHYIQQRFKRILPPFIFAIALTCFLYLIAPFVFVTQDHSFLMFYEGLMIREEYIVEFTSLMGSLFFVNGFLTPTVSANAPLWSLSYEVWFYVLAGFLPFIHKNHLVLIPFTIILGSLAFLNLQFLIYFLMWSFAFALSFATVQKQLTTSLRPMQYFFIIAAISIAIWDHYQFQALYQTNIYTTENFTIFNLCMGIAASCWLIDLQHHQQKFPIFLPNTAQFSYTLYVTHFPLLLFIFGCFADIAMQNIFSAWLSLIVSMAVLITIAWVLARYLEPRRITRE